MISGGFMSDFSGNVTFFTEDFHTLVQPYNPVVQEVASSLNNFSYATIPQMLTGLVGTLASLFNFDTDQNVWGVEEHWASPDEMMQSGAGDCDDFALFASSTLNALGVPHELVMGYFHGAGGHAWIEVHEGGTAYLLEFSEPHIYQIPVDDYSFTPYYPVERVGVE